MPIPPSSLRGDAFTGIEMARTDTTARAPKILRMYSSICRRLRHSEARGSLRLVKRMSHHERASAAVHFLCEAVLHRRVRVDRRSRRVARANERSTDGAGLGDGSKSGCATDVDAHDLHGQVDAGAAANRPALSAANRSA